MNANGSENRRAGTGRDFTQQAVRAITTNWTIAIRVGLPAVVGLAEDYGKLHTRLPVLDRAQTGQGAEGEQESLVAIGLRHVTVTSGGLPAFDDASTVNGCQGRKRVPVGT